MLFRFILCDKCYLTCKIRKTTVGLGKKQKSKQCYFLTSKCIYFCHRRYTFRTQHAEITARTGGTLLTIWGLASSPVSHYYLVAPLQSLHSLAVMHRSLHMIFSLVTSLPFSSLKHHLCSPVCTAFLQLLHNLPFKVSLLYYLCQVTCFFGDPCSPATTGSLFLFLSQHHPLLAMKKYSMLLSQSARSRAMRGATQ